MNELQLSDIKVRVLFTIKEDDEIVDISGATTKQIIIQNPNGASTTYTASFMTDGTDGQLYYETQSGELDIVGTWKCQAKVVLSGGTYRSPVQSFRVNNNL